MLLKSSGWSAYTWCPVHNKQSLKKILQNKIEDSYLYILYQFAANYLICTTKKKLLVEIIVWDSCPLIDLVRIRIQAFLPKNPVPDPDPDPVY
jgi:hypothetical protein